MTYNFKKIFNPFLYGFEGTFLPLEIAISRKKMDFGTLG
jgi:hypothetical protein